MNRTRRIIVAALVLIAGGGGVAVSVLTANESDFDPMACVEMQRAALRSDFPGAAADKLESIKGVCGDTVVKRPDGFFCNNGLLYGPGLGGVHADGTPATCTPQPGDVWYPPVVSMGVDPDDVATGKLFEPPEELPR